MQEYDVIRYYEALEAFVDGREIKPFDIRRLHRYWVQVKVMTTVLAQVACRHEKGVMVFPL